MAITFTVQLVGYKSLAIFESNIASVSIAENILFSDIVIESKDEQTIVAKGFSKSDAREIINLLN
jgi:hypothetical protein